mmetsp:Transcript_17842/g.30274  ORF Transcript_17842/g.30274 Transcript_17842/m.30274 type:complete len:92 (-) Transcript_17842:70-345(-)
MMGKLAQAAYTKALAPHHSWVLKQAAGVAMKAVKRRDKFLLSVCTEQKKLTGADYSEEELYSDLATLGQQSGRLAELLWALCNEQELTKLP